MTADAQRRRNLAKGTEVRQARARMKRALANGDTTAAALIAGTADHKHQATADGMPLEQLLRACGLDAIAVLQAAAALELRTFRMPAITTERRREIADAL